VSTSAGELEEGLGEGGSRRPLCPPLERKGARSSTPGTETGPLGVEAEPGHIWSSTNAGLSPSLRESRGGMGAGCAGLFRPHLHGLSPRVSTASSISAGVWGDRLFGILCCSRTPSILPLAASGSTHHYPRPRPEQNTKYGGKDFGVRGIAVGSCTGTSSGTGLIAVAATAFGRDLLHRLGPGRSGPSSVLRPPFSVLVLSSSTPVGPGSSVLSSFLLPRLAGLPRISMAGGGTRGVWAAEESWDEALGPRRWA